MDQEERDRAFRMNFILEISNHLFFQVEEVLQAKSSPFYCGGTNSCSSLSISIDKKEVLKSPITNDMIEALKIQVSSSKYGFKGQTLLNESVRSSKEVLYNRITDSTNLSHIKQDIAKCFGFRTSDIEIKGEKLVLYEKGDHFAPHFDTPKSQDYFATLILFFPSEYEGGEFILRFKGEEIVFNFSSSFLTEEIKWIAFYGDVEHEVKEVKSGKRIIMSYNIFNVKNSKKMKVVDEEPYLLHETINNFFKNSEKSLGFILDHYYPEYSLELKYLKGRDRELAKLFPEYQLSLVPITFQYSLEGYDFQTTIINIKDNLNGNILFNFKSTDYYMANDEVKGDFMFSTNRKSLNLHHQRFLYESCYYGNDWGENSQYHVSALLVTEKKKLTFLDDHDLYFSFF